MHIICVYMYRIVICWLITHIISIKKYSNYTFIPSSEMNLKKITSQKCSNVHYLHKLFETLSHNYITKNFFQ